MPPIYKFVLKLDAPTREAAVNFILQETGGAVQHDTTQPIVDEEHQWRVPVYSLDGRSGMPMSRNLDKNVEGNDLHERKEFNSVGADSPGWELGTATGPGFKKN